MAARTSTTKPKDSGAPKPANVNPDAPKSIVLFSDGTGNSSAKLFKTNVWRLYEAVDLGLPREGQRVQIAYYDNGIGTSKNKLLAIIGGVFGFGLQRNVLALYRFVCRNYCDGDRIYAFGFSRGAFTIRLVAALLATRGVVTYASEAELNARTRDVLHDLQGENEPNLVKSFARWGRADRDALVAIKRAIFGPRYVKQTRFEGVPIAFLGVWDTVAAYGGPSAEITRAIDNFIYPLTMTDHCLNSNVEVARHAVAIDDERDAFHPVLWDEREWRAKADPTLAVGSPEHAAYLNRLQQVWFAGMHSDVGGGYPDESLSFVSLLWMMEEAKLTGLRLLPEHVRRVRNMSNSLGPIHNSRGGLASYYRYQPRKIEAFFHRAVSDKSFEETQSMRDPVRGEQPYPPEGYLLDCKVHESVAARIAHGTDDYAPITLPRKFEIVPFNISASRGRGGHPRITPAVRQSLEHASTAWMSQREAVYDMVWKRRITYFATVLVTLLLVAMPLYARLFLYPSTADNRWVMERLTSWTHFTLPNLVQPWVVAFESSPVLFWILVGLTLAGWLIGRTLEGSICTDMRRLWEMRVEEPFEEPAERQPSGLQSIRTHSAYQRAVQSLKWYILPVLAGITMLLGLAYALMVIDTQISLSLAERKLCVRDQPKPKDGAPIFDVSRLCNVTGVNVVKGHHYAVEFAVPRPASKLKPWQDGSFRADPTGLPAYRMGLPGTLGAPFRRLIDARYLQPLYEIRPDDDREKRRKVQVKALNMAAAGIEEDCLIYRADFVATEDGELFLFANDVFAIWQPDFFYIAPGVGNRGIARVYIHDFSDIPRTCPAGISPELCQTRPKTPSRCTVPGWKAL